MIRSSNLKAILAFNHSTGFYRDHSRIISELFELAQSAGIQVTSKVSQKQKVPDQSTFFKSGKIKEIENLIQKTEANLLIVNEALTGIQTRNLQNILKISILEKSQLILKIFADRATSYEGKLQVELAQKLDELPRMRGAWLGSLSRQGGGFGARGPGEKALETDRRQIQKRISILRKKLKKLRKIRAQQRKLRKRNEATTFALIGYTNSGKSTLLNKLSRCNIPVKNQLFLTVDPTTRKVFVPDLKNCVLTDTVGFIQDLPPHLIEAFKATLEESLFADVLLHVIDLSSPYMNKQIQVVKSLIKDFGWNKKPIIHVYNKIDQLGRRRPLRIPQNPFRSTISAKTGEGLNHLLTEMKRAYLSLNKKRELFFPMNEEHKINFLSQEAEIDKVQKSNGGTLIKAYLSKNQTDLWKNFIIS